MKARGKIIGLELDYFTHRPKLVLQLDNQYLEGYNEIADLDDLDITIEKHKEKRSLSANAYAWVLIGEIANKVGTTKEEVYRDYIKNKGVYRVITMNKEAVPTFIKVWQERGLGWICEVSETKIAGLVDVVAYYGTSSYNTKQMAGFIDYIVQEAKSLDIETLPPKEIERLISLWS